MSQPAYCPGCGRALSELHQPDRRMPGELIGACDNPACRLWTIFHRVRGRLQVVWKIAPADRRGRTWCPAGQASA